MDKKHYFFKLIPPRPTFHLDMTADERTVMNAHIVYWQELTTQGIAIVYGPVMDPQGVYGMAIIETAGDPGTIVRNDPVVSSGLCTYALYPMQIGMMRQP